MPRTINKAQRARDRLYIYLFQSIYRRNFGQHDLLARFAEAIDQSGRAVIKMPLRFIAGIKQIHSTSANEPYSSRKHDGHDARILDHTNRIQSNPAWSAPKLTKPSTYLKTA